MALLNEDIVINSILGSGSYIKGDLKVNGFVRIDGDIDGNLETSGNLIIGERARIQGNVTARSVTIGGIVKGNVTASKSVFLLSSSVIIGDITTRVLRADENVIIHGHCIALTDDGKFETASTKWESYQSIASNSLLQSIHVSHYNSSEYSESETDN